MTTAEIKYDSTNKLCVGIGDDEVTELLINDKDISRFLRTIDRIKFKSIRVHKNNLRLVSDDEEVIIQDIRKFSEENGFSKIPSIALQAKSTIAKYNREHAKNKRRKNVSFGSRKIITTGIVAGILIATPFLTKALLNNNEINQEQAIGDLSIDKFDSLIAITQQDDLVNYTVDDLKYDLEESEFIQDAVEIGETQLIDQINDQLVAETNNSAYLNYQLSTDIEKREHAYNKYHDLVERFSAKWGMSFNLVMAILTQESGGYKTNLMQIEFDKWDEEIIKVYNFEDNRYDYFVLTNDPDKWAGQNVTCITEKDLDNPVTNISIGCVLLRKAAEYMDYHVLAAVQCNNLGKGNMDDVLEYTALETGQTIEEILADQQNISFYQYTYIANTGDPEYLSNVFAFLNDYGDVITFKHLGENNEIIEEEISIFSTQQLGGYH